MEDPIAKSKQFLSNKFTSGLVGAKSVWQNALTCQLALQFHYIILCITTLRIPSPLTFLSEEFGFLGLHSAEVKYRSCWITWNHEVLYFWMAGYVAGSWKWALSSDADRHIESRAICHRSAAGGDHCCKILQTASGSETQLGKNKVSATLTFRSPPSTAQYTGTYKEIMV